MGGSGGTALSKVPGETSPAVQALLSGVQSGDSTNYSRAPYDVEVLKYLERALHSPNPFTTATPVDSSIQIGEIDARNRLYHQALLSKLARTESDWSDFVDTAEAKADSVVMDATSVDDAVDTYEAAIDPVHNRQLNAYASTMYAINAVESSAFLNGFAILKRGKQTDVDSYRANLEQQRGTQRTQFVLSGVQQMEQAQANLHQEKRMDAAIYQDMKTLEINALREMLSDQLEYNQKEAIYELSMFPHANNTIAAAMGAPMAPIGPSKLSQALSSAATLAATGVQVGSAGGVQGAAIGGIIGGALGFIGAMV
jgi:hypothetical protein